MLNQKVMLKQKPFLRQEIGGILLLPTSTFPFRKYFPWELPTGRPIQFMQVSYICLINLSQ